MNSVRLILCVYTVFMGINAIKSDQEILRRIKRQTDTWSWGSTDESSEEPETKINEKPSTAQELSPCERKPSLVMPDFSKPGRRLSIQKCYEYIWNIKYREEKKKLDDECREYRRKHHLQPSHAIGGRDAGTGEFPHMTAIGWLAAQPQDGTGKWIFKCGGSLISPKFVLTAGHCSQVSDRDTTVADVAPKLVRLGDKNIVSPGRYHGTPPFEINITRVIVHPQYKPPKKYYDIALMELFKDAGFTDKIQPGCLWTEYNTDTLGKEATVTGWGVFDKAKSKTSSVLQVIVIDMLESKTCDSLLEPHFNRHFNGMQDHQLCAGKLAGGVDSCQGDSGGPLQVKINLPSSSQGQMHYIVGLTSFGFDCALPNTPAVYTRVSAFLDWIEGIVWPGE